LPLQPAIGIYRKLYRRKNDVYPPAKQAREIH
jgi:hypothetical protein